jgi:hypothetical protein
MKPVLLLAVALSTLAMPALAHTGGGVFITGEQLHADLQAYTTYYSLGNHSDPNRAMEGSRGVGYVYGTFDALSRIGLICVPLDVKVDQAEAVVMKYLQDHPEQWNQSGADLTYYALSGAFHCPKVGH